MRGGSITVTRRLPTSTAHGLHTPRQASAHSARGVPFSCGPEAAIVTIVRPLLMLAGLVGAGLATRQRLREADSIEFRGQVVLITGGSRGLGLLLAREFGREGAQVA